ncbi:unnamed protein product [Allacma fusca]|uniref:Uncharacterized protein n=1 Tax=Allacma fusca TaxID=39272 RepID=A0A8J2KWT5_9HEXA|nr:unnamed protein product [Allacma fusca]
MDDLDDYVVRPKKVRCDPPYSSPSFVRSPSSFLPSTKVPQSHQHSTNEQQSGINLAEMDRVKKMLLLRLGHEDGEEVNLLLDKMTKKISSLEQICRSQAKYIQEVSPVKTGVELQTKVNTMEAELQSLKKQLLRRHVQSEEI